MDIILPFEQTVLILSITAIVAFLLGMYLFHKTKTKLIFVEKFPQALLVKANEDGNEINAKIHNANATFIKTQNPLIVKKGLGYWRLYFTHKITKNTLTQTIWHEPTKDKDKIDSFTLGSFGTKQFFRALLAELRGITRDLFVFAIGAVGGAGGLSLILMIAGRL